MVSSMLNKIYRVLIAFVCAGVLLSCEQDIFAELEIEHSGNTSVRQEAEREYNDDIRSVLLLYSAGFNSICSYLEEDVQDLMKGWLPGPARKENVLLVYSHVLAKRGNYSVDKAPTLTRLWSDSNGNIMCDTLMCYPENTRSATPEQLHSVLEYVKNEFPARSYGMIFSSHATGYLPSGYYTKPNAYVYKKDDGLMYRNGNRSFCSQPVPYAEPFHDPSMPQVKSVGQDQVGPYGNYVSYEIEIEDFARALPMYMDYILFDACLMGGVEVAYELAGRCGKVGFSQTEVLAEGFDYKSISSHLLTGGVPDLQTVCSDFFNQYDIQVGIYRSATISLVDCSRLEPLADVCAELFSKYREDIASLKPAVVQRYYRYKYHWFYDLVDIVAKAGATQEELAALNEALRECVIYKAATPEFMGSFKISSHSGFSMYLPCDGGKELDKYYRTLKWNIATGLVE